MHSAAHEQGISDLGAQRCPMVRKRFPHRNVTSPPRRPGRIGRACRKLGHLIHPSHHPPRHAFSQGAPSSASTHCPDSGLISVPPDLSTASCLCSNGRNRPRSRPWHACRDPGNLGSRLFRRSTRGAAGLSVALGLPAGSPPAVYGKARPAQSQFWHRGQVGNSESSGLQFSLYSCSSSGLSALGYYLLSGCCPSS